jgi:hypothetical protein
MSLTGAPRPTFLYPRFKYGTPTITLDIPEPAMAVLPQPVSTIGLAGENRVANGKAEVMFGRLEESCGLVMRCEADTLQALRWMCEDSVFRGNQFQAWIDRYTGSCWMFENNLKDQNGLSFLFAPSGTPTYGPGSTGTGVILGGANYLTVYLTQASATTPTGYDDPLHYLEGVLVIDFQPAFASSDSTAHYIVTATGPALAVYKDTLNRLVLQVGTTSGNDTSGAVTWAANARVQIVAQWRTDGTRGLWYAVNSGAFVALTTESGSPATMSSLPTVLFIGADHLGANPALGTYDTVAIFKRAFTNPLLLTGYRPWRRNYFPYGEIIQRQFAPTRVSFARPIEDWAMLFRNGQP